jgi:hypothetical protein
MIGVAILMSLAIGASAQLQVAGASDQAQARYKIFVMEGVLERAVQNGAAVLSRLVRTVAPDAIFLSGAAQVRGFRLEGYGVFFDVEVPALRPTFAWTLRTMVDENGVAATTALAQLKAHIQTVRDPRERAELQRAIRRLELQVGPSPAATRVASGDATTVSGQAVIESLPAPPPPPAPPVLDPALLADPAEAYTRAVKDALVDAMIENSGPLAIGPDEWLTIAARDSEPGNRLVPGDAYDFTTWVIRVTGSDLAAFRAGRLTIDEARKKVEVKEF